MALCWHFENALTILKTKKMRQSDNNNKNATSHTVGLRWCLPSVLYMTYILIYNYIYSYNTILIILRVNIYLTMRTIGTIGTLSKKVDLNTFKLNKFLPNRLAL